MAAPAAVERQWQVSDFKDAFTDDAIKEWNAMVDTNAPGLPHWDSGVEETILRDWMPGFLALGRKRTGNAEITKADDDLTLAVRLAMEQKEHGILDTLPSFIPRKISKTRRNDIHDQRKRFFFAIRRYLLEWLTIHASELSRDQMKAIYVYMNSWTEGTGRAREAIHARLEPDHPLTIYDQTNIINAKQKPLPTPAIIPGIVAAIPEPQPAFVPVVLEPPMELNSPNTAALDALAVTGNYAWHMDFPAAAASSNNNTIGSPVYDYSQRSNNNNHQWYDQELSFSQDLLRLSQPQEEEEEDLTTEQIVERGVSALETYQAKKKQRNNEGEAITTKAKLNTTDASTVCARRVCTHRCPSPAIVCHRCLDTVHASYCSQECCEADVSDHTALCELERQMAQVRV